MEVYHILIILGILAFLLEIFTAGFISGSIGVGFFFAAIGNYLGLDAKWQIIMFSIGIMLTFFLIRPIILKVGFRNQKLKINKEGLFDKVGKVTQEINSLKDIGRVSIDGDEWKAKALNNEVIEIGTLVKIVSIESIILIVEPLN